VLISDAELDGARLAREVGGLLAAPQRMAEMSNAARAVAKPDAAERVAGELLSLVSNDGH
jgi:UDP-N-acetylglucosamine--N-acetylmuramyl-(pentapeptide) pyrophosphoryl-undecaprenol N-acetylglucosamine transferase